MCCFFLSLPHRLSFASFVFDFNASLNDFAPLFVMLLPVDLTRSGKTSGLLMNDICVVSFVFTAQIEFSECCV